MEELEQLKTELNGLDLDNISESLRVIKDRMHYVLRNMESWPDEDDMDRLNEYTEKLKEIQPLLKNLPSVKRMNNLQRYVDGMRYVRKYTTEHKQLMEKVDKYVSQTQWLQEYRKRQIAKESI